MRVTACIVGFLNVDDVVRCVTSLGRQTHVVLDIVICENGGTSSVETLGLALPTQLPAGGMVRVLQSRGNLGYAGGFNACVAASPDADAWWLVNPDCEPEADSLSMLLDRLALGDCDAVGGTIVRPDGSVQGYGGRFILPLARAVSIGHGTGAGQAPSQATIERQMNYILGACMLIGRRFIDIAGPMREDYFLYAEEIEWCLRARARGLRLGFAPKAVIRHDQGSTTGSALSISQRPWLPIYLDERNKLNVVRDISPVWLPLAAFNSLGLIGLRYSRRGAWRQTGDALAGWWAGLCGRRGMPDRLTRSTSRQ